MKNFPIEMLFMISTLHTH